MIPRVFVSSTYYDLKHVRERLEGFIENYGFEPVLFESDKVIYQHGKKIDESAYYEVSLCHVMILLIGGRYGSPSSQAKEEEERKVYDDKFVSITRKEFETAITNNIPILIFIDKNVYAEYLTYKKNQDFFDTLSSSDTKDKSKFNFAHVDHVNVFRFIDTVINRPIKTFEKVDEIEAYAKSQLSGMFYLYLESLKKGSEEKEILDTITELKNVSLSMNEMLNSVGKEILGKKNKEEYEAVIKNQLEMVIDFYAEKFGESISFMERIDEELFKTIPSNKVSEIIYRIGLKPSMERAPKGTSLIIQIKFNKDVEKGTLLKINLELGKVNEKIAIKDFPLRRMQNIFYQKVAPFIKTDEDEKILIEKLEAQVSNKLVDDLPF